MGVALVLAVVGALLVVTGIGFAERSWGSTYALAALGAVVIVAAAIRLVRGRKARAHASGTYH